MTIRNPFAPPDPDELRQFGESVNKGVESYSAGLRQTIRDTRRAVGGIVGDTVGLPFQVPVAAGNVLGWGFGAVSGSMYKISHAANRSRGSIRRVLSGNNPSQSG